MSYFSGKIFKKFSIILFTFFIFLLSFQIAFARSYFYDSIETRININQDSTFNVEERQVFNYQGGYNSGWRSIPLTKVDAISDIKVIDGENGYDLVYSSKRLDKFDPASWGKFTYFRENGNQNIEWYYNLSDTSHEWIVKYKVHGGIGFFTNYDELYWNIFTDYEVPVKNAAATVTLPEIMDYTDAIFKAYRTDPRAAYFIDKNPLPDGRSFIFEAKNFSPREAFTVQMSWPKGIVHQSAYWRDFLRIYLFYILAGLITIANLIFIIIHWYFREVRTKGRGTIIPQYAPPENLRPAMAEVLLKEKVTDKGWSATVIDLAVRGYIKIKEDTADWTDILGRGFAIFILFGIILIFSWAFFYNLPKGMIIEVLVIAAFLYFFLSRIKAVSDPLKNGKIKEIFIPKNYILEKVDSANESVLEDYEISFLRAIFRNGKTFSTKAMKRASDTRKKELYEAMERLKEKLYGETAQDTGAFEVGMEKEKIGAVIFLAVLFAIMIILAVIKPAMSGEVVFILIVALNFSLLYIYLKYEARLSKKGLILKEDWLGFKMYLETAERYRMQNLTPETFEKYLPYAIIFGIEEKWGKAFETFNIQNPSWYSGAYVGSGFHSGRLPAGRQGFSSGGGFSPAGFSASFSSSFSSAFSSAGGAGSAGGGGGGAGGGGGGGGGGAS